MLPSFIHGQEEVDKSQAGDAHTTVIKGEFSLPQGFNGVFEWKDLKPQIIQRITVEPPPFPVGWENLTPEERSKWINDFENSEAGKTYNAARQKQLESRLVFAIDIEADGKFIVYDVPQGDYFIEGWLVTTDRDNESIRLRVDAFGEFTVGEADEIELGITELFIQRIFDAGDLAPEIEITTLEGSVLRLSELRGSYLLIDYWGSSFGASEFMLPQLQRVEKDLSPKYGIKILSISLDPEVAAAKAFVESKGITWLQGHAGSWEHPAVTAFAVRSSPSYWLIGPDGKIVLTNFDFSIRYPLARSIDAVIEDRLSDKNEFLPKADGADDKESDR